MGTRRGQPPARRGGGCAAMGRSDLLTAALALESNVIDLQRVEERASLYAPGGDEQDHVLCPFKGLASFEMDDAHVFFGRDRLVAELVARLVGSPLLGVVGPSGSGKSSVVRAGLMPALAAGMLPGSERWHRVLLRPGDQPMTALTEAVETTDGDEDGTRHVLVVVDQFEETFTACRDDAERATFVSAITAAARNPHGRFSLVFAIRAAFYGRCAAYPDLADCRHEPCARRVDAASGAAPAIELPARGQGFASSHGSSTPVSPTSETSRVRSRFCRRRSSSSGRSGTGARSSWSGTRRAAAYAARWAGWPRRLCSAERASAEDRSQHAAAAFLRRGGGVGATSRSPLRVRPRRERGCPGRSRRAHGQPSADGQRRQVEVAHEALLREWPRLRGWLRRRRGPPPARAPDAVRPHLGRGGP